jgi:hypothetical protein
MKALLILLIFLLICEFAPAQTKPYKGKIKSVTWYFFNAPVIITIKHPKSWVTVLESHYDTAGRVTWEYMHGRSLKNNSSDTIRYTYDKEGRTLKIYSKNWVTVNYSYRYDKQNNLVVTDNNLKHAPVVEIINEENRTDTIFDYDISGGYMGKVIHKYNADKTVLNLTRLNKDGGLQDQSIQILDDQNRLIDLIVIEGEFRITHNTYKYDKYGYIRIDSNQRFNEGPPGKKVADRIYSYTYKYEKLDKLDNPLITSLLIDDKYILIGKTKYKYY